MNLSDFLAAKPSDVSAMNIDMSPIGQFPGVEAKGVEVVKMVTLLNLVDGSSFEDHLDNLDSFFVRDGGDSGLG